MKKIGHFRLRAQAYPTRKARRRTEWLKNKNEGPLMVNQGEP